MQLSDCLQTGIELGNRWGASYPLDALATLAVAERQYERAARIFGASEAQRARAGIVPKAAEHPALQAILAKATDFHGLAIDNARNEGRRMSLDAAVAFAVGAP